MSRKTLIIILWSVSLTTLLVVLIAYSFNFYTNGISNDPATWGQFGDYIGGTLNPVIALLNLIVLTYLSIKISDAEEERNKFTLQELVRPLADIATLRSQHHLEIILKNCGLGPLKIKKIILLFEGKEYTTFEDLFPSIPIDQGPIEYEFFSIIEGDESIIAKDSKESLVKLKAGNNDKSNIPYFHDIFEILHKTKISIEYNDIYDRPMPQINVDYSKAKKFVI